MMDKNKFWELIQTSYKEADWVTDKEMGLLINKLAEYSQEEILKFGKIYEIYANESYKSKLWAAACVMNKGCSDDCFDYFRGWLISRGKEPYLNALLDPDSIVDLDIPYEDDYYENEAMLSVALEAFNKKIGTDDINVYFERIKEFELDSEETFDIVDEIAFGEDIDAKWDDDDEESLRKIVPKLYEQFW
ncbi:hypothetical protein ALNOE001_12450 [Candidatus Methanobinarius endosymbioticus]|uniref:DUF4240 domain-containing protein n=1 Tax=Candidatus Methanobinarius endosymbioticus TaxID=2006182 RepID=A0A366M9S4_9EURY|nr:hypothetical protein ALNOE001_12450 [Candidatus Methanobinarius endosymbioticus]